MPRSHRLPWAEVGGIFLQGSTLQEQSPIPGTGCAQHLASSSSDEVQGSRPP